MKKEEPRDKKDVKRKKEYERPVLSKYQQIRKVAACPD